MGKVMWDEWGRARARRRRRRMVATTGTILMLGIMKYGGDTGSGGDGEGGEEGEGR